MIPRYIVIAGPNGAGKSTMTALRRGKLDVEIIDPDAIARDLAPNAPAHAAIAAGRAAKARLHRAISEQRSVLQETTLSGNGIIANIVRAKAAGFMVELHYIGLDTWDWARERVTLRAARGGHDVPTADIRRRYVRGLNKLPSAMSQVDWTFLWDNSSDRGHQLFAILQSRTLVARSGKTPTWALQLLM